MCREDAVTTDNNGLWGTLSGVWTDSWAESNTYRHIFPADYSNANLRIGIGTKTPEFKLSIDGGTTGYSGILAKGLVGSGMTLGSGSMAGTKLIWYPRKASFLAGSWTAASPVPNDDTMNEYNVIIGWKPKMTPCDNSHTGSYGTIYCGNDCEMMTDPAICSVSSNPAFGNYQTIGGGANQISMGMYSTIAGGTNSKIASGLCHFIGRSGNAIQTSNAVIINGLPGSVAGSESYAGHVSFLGVGENLKSGAIYASGTYSQSGSFCVVAGGKNNSANIASYSLVGGGENNSATGLYAAILGGQYNQASAQSAAIAGGGSSSQYNIAGGAAAALLGGWGNTAGSGSAGYNLVGGGTQNTASGEAATIFDGANNTASGANAFIGNGSTNTASGESSTILSGLNNTISGQHGFIGSGANNTISGNYSAILTGQNINIASDYSFAAGRASTLSAAADNSFVWNSSTTPITVSQANTFIINSSKIGINTATPDSNALLHVNGDVQVQQLALQNNSGLPILDGMPNDLYWDTTTGKILSADIAETFTATEKVSIGDVLTIDSRHPGKIKKSRAEYDQKALGVVSAAPALVFEDSRINIAPQPLEFKSGKNPPVALAGRVWVRVSLENGPIAAGDLLTSAKTPGHAMKVTDKSRARHAIIGKALEPFSGGEKGNKTGMIEALIMLR